MAVAMVLYHMWIIVVGPSEAIIFRGTHLMFALVLCFLIYGSKAGVMRPIPSVLDYAWLAAASRRCSICSSTTNTSSRASTTSTT